MKLTAETLEDALCNLLEQIQVAHENVLEAGEDAGNGANPDDDILADAGEGLESISDVSTFHSRGLMTSDRGLVIRTSDGREFQLTIVQSK